MKRRRKRSQAVISYTMSRIRSKDTSIERTLRCALWRAGLRYRKHYPKAPGTPDMAFVSARIAVFADSTFWHGRDWSERKSRMKTNKRYWVQKIERNMARDRRVNDELKAMGWLVLRFWDVDIEGNLPKCVRKVVLAMKRRNRVNASYNS